MISDQVSHALTIRCIIISHTRDVSCYELRYACTYAARTDTDIKRTQYFTPKEVRTATLSGCQEVCR
jgi:hypothetical protein